MARTEEPTMTKIEEQWHVTKLPVTLMTKRRHKQSVAGVDFARIGLSPLIVAVDRDKDWTQVVVIAKALE